MVDARRGHHRTGLKHVNVKFGRVPVLILRHVSEGELSGKREVKAEVGRRRREVPQTCAQTVCEREAARCVHVKSAQHVLAVVPVSILVVFHARIPWAEALESVFILPKGPISEIASTNVRIKAREHIRRKRGHWTLRGGRERLDGRRIFTVHPVSGLEVTGLTHEHHQHDEQHGSTGRERRGCAGHDSRRNVEDQEGLTLS